MTIVTAPCGAQEDTSIGAIPEAAAAKVALAGSIAMLLVFALLIKCGLKSSEGKFGKGELRRAIAGMLVVGFSIIAILSFVYGILREHIVTAYIELVGIVIGFYFGQRTVESTIETEREEEREELKQQTERLAIEREKRSATPANREEEAEREGQEGKG